MLCGQAWGRNTGQASSLQKCELLLREEVLHVREQQRMMLSSPGFQFGTNLDSRILVQSETSSQVGRVQLRTTSLRTAKDSTTGVLPAGLMGLVVALAGHGSERARNQKSSAHQDKDRQPEETNEDRDRSQLFGWQGAAVSRNSKGQKKRGRRS